MPNAKSHHCLEPETHVLVLIDHQPREARYRTVWDDGSESETIHVLYWEPGPKEAQGGEVRSMPAEEYPAVQPLTLGEPPTFAALIGTDAATLPSDAADFLRQIGAVDTQGKARAR